MGLFDFINGTKSAPKDVPRQPREVLYGQLLGLNRPGSPWGVRDGRAEGVDLIAEWKIVDAQWYQIFAKAGLEEVFQVLLKFDDEAGEVRAVEKGWRVEWQAGVPRLSASVEGFRGQKKEVSFGKAIAFREEDLRLGVVYDYRFDTKEIKEPLRETALANGWGWRGVSFGKL